MNTEKKPEYKVMSPKTSSPQGPERSGVLKRFLGWIARGAKKSNLSAGSCPT
jgi:hypothetical protein